MNLTLNKAHIILLLCCSALALFSLSFSANVDRRRTSQSSAGTVRQLAKRFEKDNDTPANPPLIGVSGSRNQALRPKTNKPVDNKAAAAGPLDPPSLLTLNKDPSANGPAPDNSSVLMPPPLPRKKNDTVPPSLLESSCNTTLQSPALSAKQDQPSTTSSIRSLVQKMEKQAKAQADAIAANEAVKNKNKQGSVKPVTDEASKANVAERTRVKDQPNTGPSRGVKRRGSVANIASHFENQCGSDIAEPIMPSPLKKKKIEAPVKVDDPKTAEKETKESLAQPVPLEKPVSTSNVAQAPSKHDKIPTKFNTLKITIPPQSSTLGSVTLLNTGGQKREKTKTSYSTFDTFGNTKTAEDSSVVKKDKGTSHEPLSSPKPDSTLLKAMVPTLRLSLSPKEPAKDKDTFKRLSSRNDDENDNDSEGEIGDGNNNGPEENGDVDSRRGQFVKDLLRLFSPSSTPKSTPRRTTYDPRFSQIKTPTGASILKKQKKLSLGTVLSKNLSDSKLFDDTFWTKWTTYKEQTDREKARLRAEGSRKPSGFSSDALIYCYDLMNALRRAWMFDAPAVFWYAQAKQELLSYIGAFKKCDYLGLNHAQVSALEEIEAYVISAKHPALPEELETYEDMMERFVGTVDTSNVAYLTLLRTYPKELKNLLKLQIALASFYFTEDGASEDNLTPKALRDLKKTLQTFMKRLKSTSSSDTVTTSVSTEPVEKLNHGAMLGKLYELLDLSKILSSIGSIKQRRSILTVRYSAQKTAEAIVVKPSITRMRLAIGHSLGVLDHYMGSIIYYVMLSDENEEQGSKWIDSSAFLEKVRELASGEVVAILNSEEIDPDELSQTMHREVLDREGSSLLRIFQASLQDDSQPSIWNWQWMELVHTLLGNWSAEGCSDSTESQLLEKLKDHIDEAITVSHTLNEKDKTTFMKVLKTDLESALSDFAEEASDDQAEESNEDSEPNDEGILQSQVKEEEEEEEEEEERGKEKASEIYKTPISKHTAVNLNYLTPEPSQPSVSRRLNFEEEDLEGDKEQEPKEQAMTNNMIPDNDAFERQYPKVTFRRTQARRGNGAMRNLFGRPDAELSPF